VHCGRPQRRERTGAGVGAFAKGVGGEIEGFDLASGETVAFVIGGMPNNASAAAVSLTVGASGAASVETVVLLTPAEADEAAKKTVKYRAPGAK